MIWNCKDFKIEYGEKTLIMGIVNITPDSFSDAGKNFCTEAAVNTALLMQQQGADIIDFGAQSTRPGCTAISAEEEWERLKPVLDAVRGRISVPVSVDTFYASVAERAIEHGASIINDVSGRITHEMSQIVKKTGAGWIIMHNGAGAEKEVKEFFDSCICELSSLSVNSSQVCFDMGIGFGKTRQQDACLIANAGAYKPKNFPLLLGSSRKRVIGEGSGEAEPSKRLFGNISADAIAIAGGVNVIRLHDVANEKQGIYMADFLKKHMNKES